jgi:hypothetical protein
MLLNMDSGMTKGRYLEMCKQLKKEPSPKECPPDIDEDFPELITLAFLIFNRLGNRYAEGIFIGKDYHKLPFYIDIYDIQDDDLEFFLDILSYLENRAITKASEQAKKEMAKVKRENSGK